MLDGRVVVAGPARMFGGLGALLGAELLSESGNLLAARQEPRAPAPQPAPATAPCRPSA